MRNIGIIVNSNKDPEGKILKNVVDCVYNVIRDSSVYEFKDSVGEDENKIKNLDVVISLGGDGTILSTARELAQYAIPILGINIGNLGFLTEVESSEFEYAINCLKDNHYYIEERMMLDCTIENDLRKETHNCLNDIVLSKGTLARILKYDIYVNDIFYTTFTADGVILSTPTGSTAYALSAGGPIIYPTLSLMSITPICPHSLGVRTLVLDGKSSITVKLSKKYGSAYLTVDGQQAVELNENDVINVNMSKLKCRLVKLDKYDYFNILRKKITSRTKECEGDI